MKENVEKTALERLHHRQSLIKDRIRAVVHQEANGVYLHGRPGSSKTYLICKTLETLGVRYGYSNGHLTPLGLFDLLAENHDSVIVLDDVSSIFNAPQSLQILLAALGTSPDGSRVRHVRYKTAAGDRIIPFAGSIIAISNLQLTGHANAVLDALQDRVHVMAYEPADEELEAAIYEIAGQEPRGVPAKEAWMVAQFLIGQCREVGVRISIRLYLDKAISDFRLWHAGNSECDWQDLIASSVRQMVIPQKQELRDMTRNDRIAAERNLVMNICSTYCSPGDRITEWRQQTGKGKSSFYRRQQELQNEGLLVA